MYEVLLEKNDRIMKLGQASSKEEAERKMISYIDMSEDSDFCIWIEEADINAS